jgi:hypothetical protein
MASPDQVAGRWVHSHEEDTPDEMVFRSADYAFPPSRGREAIELRPDGSYAGTVPGPVDKPVAGDTGEWALSDDGRRLRLGDRELEVVDAKPGVLRVRRTSTGAG